MSEKPPLSVGGLYDLLTDPRRRRLVLPHKIVPLLAELVYALEQLFDAVGAVTSDPRWPEAANVLEAARALLNRAALEKPLERARHAFEGAKASRPARKGMAMIRAGARVLWRGEKDG